jgi:membrane-associated phospholipid phosphatase
MKKFIREVITEIELKTLLVSLLFIICLFVFGYLAHEIVGENETAFDENAFHFFAAFSSPRFITINRIFTFFGASYFSISAYIILLAILFIGGRKSDGINIAIIAISSTALMFLLKEFFHRKRPDLPVIRTLPNFSFPSGHALSSFIFCSVLIYLIWKGALHNAWKWVLSVLLILFSICIGISRIVLRYHYATDVIAGFCLALAWVIFSLWLERKLTPRRVELQLDSRSVS